MKNREGFYLYQKAELFLINIESINTIYTTKKFNLFITPQIFLYHQYETLH